MPAETDVERVRSALRVAVRWHACPVKPERQTQQLGNNAPRGAAATLVKMLGAVLQLEGKEGQRMSPHACPEGASAC